MFTHIPMPEIKRPFVRQLDRTDGHYYETDDGKIYPSVTTIQKSIPKPGLDYWKANTPNWEQISKNSTDVGTALHKLAEEYLNNRPQPALGDHEFEKDPVELFVNALKPHLDDHIDNIYATEAKMYSHELQLAGTVDCIAEYDGMVSIIDFKNSRKPKMPSHIKSSGYYEQMTAYREMWKFCTKHHVEQAVVLVVSWDNKVRPFKVNPDDYLSSLWDQLITYELSKK